MSVEDAVQTYYWMLGIVLTDGCSQSVVGSSICPSCWSDWLAVEAASLALDLAVAQQHRVMGGPHPRLLGLTDGAALARAAGVAWS